MKFKNEYWVIVPARSGSKSIINKNIKLINNKPLIAYSLLAAKKNRHFKKIIFSSDSVKYFNIAKKYSNFFFHKRGKRISGDNVTEIKVLQDFIKIYSKKNEFLPEFFVSFRPTSPVRYQKTINKALKIFKNKAKKYSGLRSVSLMSETSFKTHRIVEKKLCALEKKDFNIEKYNLPRQSYPKTYEANGIIDIYKTKNILNGSGLGNKVFPFIVNDINSDIDDLDDLEYVKYYVKKNKFKI